MVSVGTKQRTHHHSQLRSPLLKQKNTRSALRKGGIFFPQSRQTPLDERISVSSLKALLSSTTEAQLIFLKCFRCENIDFTIFPGRRESTPVFWAQKMRVKQEAMKRTNTQSEKRGREQKGNSFRQRCITECKVLRNRVQRKME